MRVLGVFPWIKIHTKKSALIFLVFLCAAACLLFFKTLSGPAEGIIDNRANLTPNPAPQTPKDIPVRGKYVNFTYLDSFRALPVSKPSSSQLESFDYVTKHSPFWELVVGVSSLPSGNLNDDGSYNMRSSAGVRYKLEHWDIKGVLVPVFSDTTENYSKVAFLAHSGKLLSLALSGSGDKVSMQAEQMRVLNSLEWQD
jgi:hypothetical protein